MRSIRIFCVFILFVSSFLQAQIPDDPKREQAITRLLKKMTLEEKVSLVGGTGFETTPIDHLNLPRLYMTDGPHGVRWGKATCFPTGVGLGSTWDPDLLYRVGEALAEECLFRGRNVLLGPCINIHRMPLGGRNFESYSEDPYLTSRLAVGYIRGVQSKGVAACPKHYAANNQEYERTTIDVQVSDRALQEIYLPAFKASVQEGGAWTIMASYNRINGSYACANKPLLTDILKTDWGFQGLVMSDWGAVHSTVPTVKAGTDLEMPNARHLGDDLLAAIQAGEVTEKEIDAMVRRTLRVMHVMGLFKDPDVSGGKERHDKLALEVAESSIILLKNENDFLPLDPKAKQTIAVIGPNAAEFRNGGGSSWVSPFESVTPLQGLENRLGDNIEIVYHQGCTISEDEFRNIVPAQSLSYKGKPGIQAEYFDNTELSGEPVLVRTDHTLDFDWGGRSPVPELGEDIFSVRWTGSIQMKEPGKYRLVIACDDGVRLFLNGKLVIDQWNDHAVANFGVDVVFKAGKSVDFVLEFYENRGDAVCRMGYLENGESDLGAAAEIAARADAVIIFAGLTSKQEGEGHDRDSMDLPGEQDELIRQVVKANPNTVVCLINGTPVGMTSWLSDVPAVIEAWYPGQQGGEALASILFGDVNPSGRLTITLPEKLEDVLAMQNYPGKNGKLYFKEELMIGYRYFDTKEVEPLFPFGHGLSYTDFEYSDLSFTKKELKSEESLMVSLKLRNTGDREGSEVVQVYVHDDQSSVFRPEQELKAFKKVHLKPGEEQTVMFEFGSQAFSFYNDKKGEWDAEPGIFEFRIGASSRDIRLKDSVTLK